MPRQLHISGKFLLDDTNREVVLRGANVINAEWTGAALDTRSFDIPAVKRLVGSPSSGGWGANLVVVGFAVNPVNQGNVEYYRMLNDYVVAAREGSMGQAYVLFMPRSYGINTEQPPTFDQRGMDALARLGNLYKNDPSVLYACQVEPHDVALSDLRGYQNGAIATLRFVHPAAVIFAAGMQWGRYVDWALTSPLSHPDIGYKTHIYDTWGVVQESFKLAEVAERYPLLIGEFGAGTRTPYDDAVRILDFAEEKGIHWAAWLFHYKAPPTLLTSGAPSFTPSSPYGAHVMGRLKSAYSAPEPQEPPLPVPPIEPHPEPAPDPVPSPIPFPVPEPVPVPEPEPVPVPEPPPIPIPDPQPVPEPDKKPRPIPPGQAKKAKRRAAILSIQVLARALLDMEDDEDD